MNLKKLLPVVLIAALAALGNSGNSGAAAAANPIIDPCLTEPADTTLWLGQGVSRVEAYAGSLAYAGNTRPCTRFIVDIQVPFNSSGGWGFTPAFSIEATAPFSGLCERQRQWTFVFRKNPREANFEYLGHLGLHGEDERNCELVAWEGHDDPWPSSFDPPNARVATYRVLASAWYEGWSWQSADVLPPRVRATHLRVL